MIPKPFQTLRSLVGMTMGARKRAARRWLWPDDNRRDALRMFRDMAAEWTNNGEKYEYGLARKPYRIGQRLRPCPNCLKCWPWKRIVEGVAMACPLPPVGVARGRYWFLRCAQYDICDGSGVLPARAKKVMR